MALSVKQGTFQLDTATGTQQVTDVGFEPRAVIFWWGGGNADGTGNHERGSLGFAGDDKLRVYNSSVGEIGHVINQGSHAWMTRHNVNPTQAAAIYAPARAILAINTDSGTPSVRAKASVTKYLSNGFELNIATRDTNAMQVYYLALGGSDIEEADVVTMQAPAGTGNQDYTTEGVRPVSDPNTPVYFQPTMLFAAGAQATVTTPGGATDAGPHFGAARLSTERHSVAASNLDAAATANARHINRADALITEVGESRADLNAFLSDGFRLNWGAIGGTRRYSSVLAIKGGRWKVGTHTAPTTAIEKATTGVGFQPSTLISAGHGQTTADATNGNPYRFNFGARGPTSEAAMGGAVENGVAAPNAARSHHVGRAVNSYSHTQTAVFIATLGSFDTDGFTLDYSTVNGTAGKFMYVALAPNLQIGDGASGGIATAEVFGAGSIQSGLAGEGLPSEEAFGVGSIVGPVGDGLSGGISTEEAFGVGTIIGGLQPIPATPEPLWRMLYTDIDGVVVGEVENASARRFSFLLNHPGMISFKLDLRDRMLEEFMTRKSGLILLFRDRELKMTAELQGAELARGADNEKALAITAIESMWPRLTNRLIGKSLDGYAVETATAKGTVMSNLLTILNTEDDTGLRIGDDTTTNTIIGGPWRYKPYIELLQELSATLNGFDFRQVPANPLGTGITGYLDFAPVLGETKANAIFEFGTGKHNVKDYRWVVDRTGMINRAFSLPSEFPDNVLLEVASSSDAPQITAEGLREAVVSQDLKDYDLRVQLAAEHVAVRKFPMERFFFTPAPNIDLEPLSDYDVGDIITGRVMEQGVVALNAQVRCYGITVEPNDEGQETVNLTLVDE